MIEIEIKIQLKSDFDKEIIIQRVSSLIDDYQMKDKEENYNQIKIDSGEFYPLKNQISITTKSN